MRMRREKDSGFTLLEVLIAILILGIIATAAVSLLGSFTEKAREARQTANTLVKMQAQERYSLDHHAPLGYVWEDSSSSFIPFELASLTGPSKQLLAPTDINGNVMGDAVSTTPGPFAYGPYLAQLPADAASLLLGVAADATGTPPISPIFEPLIVAVDGDTLRLTARVRKLMQGVMKTATPNPQASENEWSDQASIENLPQKLVRGGFTHHDLVVLLDMFVRLYNAQATHVGDPRFDNNGYTFKSAPSSANWQPNALFQDLADVIIETGSDVTAYEDGVAILGPLEDQLACYARALATKAAWEGPKGEPGAGLVAAITSQKTWEEKDKATLSGAVVKYFSEQPGGLVGGTKDALLRLTQNAPIIFATNRILQWGHAGGTAAKAAPAASAGEVDLTGQLVSDIGKVAIVLSLPGVSAPFDPTPLVDHAEASLVLFPDSDVKVVATLLGIQSDSYKGDMMRLRGDVLLKFAIEVEQKQISPDAYKTASYLAKQWGSVAIGTNHLGSDLIETMVRPSACIQGQAGKLPYSSADLLTADSKNLAIYVNKNSDKVEGWLKAGKDYLTPHFGDISDALTRMSEAVRAFEQFGQPQSAPQPQPAPGATPGTQPPPGHTKAEVHVTLPSTDVAVHPIPKVGNEALRTEFNKRLGVRIELKQSMSARIMGAARYDVMRTKALLAEQPIK